MDVQKLLFETSKSSRSLENVIWLIQLQYNIVDISSDCIYGGNCYEEVDVDREARHITALIYSVEYRHVNIMKFLIENGANVNKSVHTGWMPLMSAFGSPKCLNLLIKAGADVNQTTENGTSALHKAFGNFTPQCIESVKILIEAGADVNCKNNINKSPLDMCNHNIEFTHPFEHTNSFDQRYYSQIKDVLLKAGAV